jgi:ABC-type phosphate transport system substrate-binding protein
MYSSYMSENDGLKVGMPRATFPYPIYATWADAYKKETSIGLNYQSIGSDVEYA